MSEHIRFGFISLCLLFLILASGCGKDKPDFRVQSSLKDGHAVIKAEKPIFSSNDIIRVFSHDYKDPGLQNPVLEAEIIGDRRYGVAQHTIEIINIPETWDRVSVFWGGESDFTLLDREHAPPKILPAAEKQGVFGWIKDHIAFVILFGLLALITISAIGVTGGPAKGQIPFIICFIHLIAFISLWNIWEPWAVYTYLALIVLALVLSVYAMGAAGNSTNYIISLIGMTVLFMGMFAVIAAKDYRPCAFWSNHHCIQVYVPKDLRGNMQVLGDEQNILATAVLNPDANGRIFFFWRSYPSPRALRFITPGRATDLPLDWRPLAAEKAASPEVRDTADGQSAFSRAKARVKAKIDYLKFKAKQSVLNKILIIIGMIVFGWLAIILLMVCVSVPSMILEEIQNAFKRRKK